MDSQEKHEIRHDIIEAIEIWVDKYRFGKITSMECLTRIDNIMEGAIDIKEIWE